LEMLGLGFVHGESPVDRLTDELYEIRSKWDKVEICRVAASFNKRMLSDWFSAALQTSRKCVRYGAVLGF
ncbi:hypothetical protein, partial [Marinibactrum halimedae]|uniref:hypothetical protein n=1 Tax=Marinibactrum halimedae TaxID=1444977 RepID=UPI001E3B97C6